MLPVRTHFGWDGITFALDPLTRMELEETHPDALRSSRVFVGTHEAHPKDVRALGPIDGDPDARLKIVAELLSGASFDEIAPLVFHVYPEEEVHRVE